jgi:hypothetical protein
MAGRIFHNGTHMFIWRSELPDDPDGYQRQYLDTNEWEPTESTLTARDGDFFLPPYRLPPVQEHYTHSRKPVRNRSMVTPLSSANRALHRSNIPTSTSNDPALVRSIHPMPVQQRDRNRRATGRFPNAGHTVEIGFCPDRR